MSEKIKLNFLELLAIAKSNPNGTDITSEVETYIDENNNTVTEFYLKA